MEPSRRLFAGMALLVFAMAACLLAPRAASATPSLVFSHLGDVDPTLEGWSLFDTGAGTQGALADDQGLAARFVKDSSGSGQLFYRQSTTAHEPAALAGWTLRATLRVAADTDRLTKVTVCKSVRPSRSG